MLDRPIQIASPARLSALASLACALLLAATVAARADLKLCNTTSSRIGVAIGYQDATGWTTEGWWNIAARTCETLYRGTLSSRFYYVHAVDYDRGGEWAGKSAMCTVDKVFTIRGVQDCLQRGFKSTGFFEVDTQEAKDWTIRLTDPSEGGAKSK
ncbi:MAG TPA: DUF1036 domain-containing protein [Hyphomicrobiaceae bacterium]|nr:DUF1036 domain-containing protein [Hyphomicrobiaceae bacterium]